MANETIDICNVVNIQSHARSEERLFSIDAAGLRGKIAPRGERIEGAGALLDYLGGRGVTGLEAAPGAAASSLALRAVLPGSESRDWLLRLEAAVARLLEHERLRARLSEEVVLRKPPPAPGSRRPSLLFVAGGPCSGKDTLLYILEKQGELPRDRTVLLGGTLLRDLSEYRESDEKHPELGAGLYPEYVHILDLLAGQALERGYDLVVNDHLVALDFCADLVRRTRAAGGVSMVMAATTPPETFFHLLADQEARTQRRADKLRALEIHRDFSRNWQRVAALFDAHALFDNGLHTLRGGRLPVICAIGTRCRGTEVSDRGAYAEFLRKGGLDPRAQDLESVYGGGAAPELEAPMYDSAAPEDESCREGRERLWTLAGVLASPRSRELLADVTGNRLARGTVQ